MKNWIVKGVTSEANDFITQKFGIHSNYRRMGFKSHFKTHVQPTIIVYPKWQWKLVKLKSLIRWPPTPRANLQRNVLRKDFCTSKIPSMQNLLSLHQNPRVFNTIYYSTYFISESLRMYLFSVNHFQSQKLEWGNIM